MRTTRFCAIAMMACLAPVTSHAAEKLLASATKQGDIAAVVGGDVISNYDVENRIKFVMATTHLSDTPDVIERIRPQIVQSLINERLELQAANKADIKVSDDDINAAIASIESERGMPSGAIGHQLDENHVPMETFRNQIHAQLAWNSLIRKNVKSHVRVTDQDIELAQKRAAVPTTFKELKIGVVTLPVDKPSRTEELMKLGDKLVKEVRGGADFAEVSRQFGGAAGGGHVETFWVKPEQLDPGVFAALKGATPGYVTDPVRTETGITIVKVYDAHMVEDNPVKDVEVTMKDILLKLKTDASDKEANVLLQIGEEVAKHPGTCDEKGIAGLDDLQDFDIEVNFNHSKLSELPPAIRIIAQNLSVGDISSPFASDEGIRLYMLCDKKDAAAPALDKDHLKDMVFQQKMELEAQKYLRNLRRETFIDVR